MTELVQGRILFNAYGVENTIPLLVFVTDRDEEGRFDCYFRDSGFEYITRDDLEVMSYKAAAKEEVVAVDALIAEVETEARNFRASLGSDDEYSLEKVDSF